MIYMQEHNGTNILILEPENLENLKKGGVTRSPNNQVVLMLSNDVVWLGERIQEEQAKGTLTPVRLGELVQESMRRPHNPDRPKHQTVQVIRDGVVVDPRSSFVCPKCGRVSHNPHDIRERYCGACHLFFTERPQ